MANKVGIVTDSTSYIPEDLKKQYAIRVAPAVVIWEGEELRDGVDIQPSAFYSRLQKAAQMPTTSQPSPAAVKEQIEAFANQGYDVLCVMVSEKLSGTIASTRQAMAMFPNAKIELVDSRSASMGLGWAILAAARAAAQGASLAECKAIAEKARDNTGVLLSVDTLEFLHRGGRIGGAQRYLGTALNFKPILELQHGVIEPVERVRTRGKAHARLIELAVERIGGRTPVRLAVIHANVPDIAKEVLKQASDVIKPVEAVISEVSPAVGTHTGPGTVGLCFIAGI